MIQKIGERKISNNIKLKKNIYGESTFQNAFEEWKEKYEALNKDRQEEIKSMIQEAYSIYN